MMKESRNLRVKSSNLEPLKAGWRWVRLGEVCEIDSNQVSPNSDLAKQLPYIGLEHIESETGKITEIINGSNGKTVQSNTFRFDSRHVLYGKLRPYLNKVATPDFEGRCTTELLPLLPKNSCNRYYLAWLLRRQETVEEAMHHKTGSRMPRADMEELFKMFIPLPPLKDQHCIASKLQELMQEIERARMACEKQFEAAKALPAAYLREVFEGEESKKWERKKLAEVCEMVMGQSPPSDSYKKEKIGLPFFQGKADFSIYFPIPQIWCSSPMRIAEPNDILISVRAPVGPVNMADQKCCIGRGLTALRGKGQIDAWFLFFYFKCIENSWKGRGSTFDAIRKDDLENIQITMPPIFEQKRLASELKEKMAQVENLQSKIFNQQSAIDALPQAILRKAFRGEL